jgi:hypothetical protein
MKNLLMTFSTIFLFAAANAQLMNPGFESWEGAGGAAYPTAWLWNPGTMEWTRTTDARSGSFALEVSVWYYYTDTKAEQWAPVNFKPTALAGYYKYTGNTIQNQTTTLTTDDTAFATIYLTKWNTTTQKTDTIGRGHMPLLGSPSYRHFSCPVVYTSVETPDTVFVSMDPSLMRNGGTYFSPSTDGRNSFLKIDDLYLQDATTDVYEVATPSVTVWPNPAREQLIVRTDNVGSVARLYDLSGRQVLTKTLSGSINKIDISSLPAGPYVLSVSDQSNNTLMTQTITHQ